MISSYNELTDETKRLIDQCVNTKFVVIHLIKRLVANNPRLILNLLTIKRRISQKCEIKVLKMLRL